MRTTRKFLTLCLVCCVGSCLAGCTFHTNVTFTSTPSGADVLVDGERVGKTPVTIPVPWVYDGTPDRTTIDMRLEGYQPASTVIRNTSTGYSYLPKCHITLKPVGGHTREETASVDVRIVSVAGGTVVTSASGAAPRGRLSDLCRSLAQKLREGVLLKGESVAVVSLRNRSATRNGRTVADEVGDKLSGALVDTRWFDVKERINLRGVVQEQDLEKSSVVKTPAVHERLHKLKYVIMGGVSVPGR
ncbi:MAG: CsgG/HfaB family protein [Phycisphaerae bacterium]|nr:CsgG/HfaB family protein [Phycisphaerae bacterium]